MNLSTATPQDIADFAIGGSEPRDLALYFHTRALSAKLAHETEHLFSMVSNPKHSCEEFTELMNAHLEGFSGVFVAWELSEGTKLGDLLAATLQEVVLSFLDTFPLELPAIYGHALTKLREWQREEREEHGDATIFGTEYEGADA